MTKAIKYIAFLQALFITSSALAQPTPATFFGVGDLKESSLPQNKAMGGISMGIRKLGAYSNINIANPASYSSMVMTTFDAGVTGAFWEPSQKDISGQYFNLGLSHLVFGIPINKKSALSFGLIPYSELAYAYKELNTGTSIDNVYKGNGGINKLYLGYGFSISPNLNIGANVSYLFGNLKQSVAQEYPIGSGPLNTRKRVTNGLSGASLDYGLQYVINSSTKSKMTLGYAGSLTTKLNATNKVDNMTYSLDPSGNETNIKITSTDINPTTQWSIPLKHTIGFAYEKTNKLLLGTDFSYSQWSNFSQGGINPGFNDSYSVAVGGQLTPDVNAISNYFKLIDYRFGLKYDRTYININNHNIDQYALTFGLGLPLQATRYAAFHKINFAAEIGKRGTSADGVVRENYMNLSLGFTMNDKWFSKRKID